MTLTRYLRTRGATQILSINFWGATKHHALTVLKAFYILLFLTIFPLQSETIFAQTVNDPRWRNYKQDDGLSTNDSWSILVDDNAIWFGENGGISRFDGTWVSYSSTSSFASDTSEGATSSFTLNIDGDVSALAQNPSTSQIWIGTDTGQLSLLEPVNSTWREIARFDVAINAISVEEPVTNLDADEQNPNDPNLSTVERVWIGVDDGLYAAEAVEANNVDAIGENATDENATDYKVELLAASSDLTLATEQSAEGEASSYFLTSPVFELYQHNDLLYAGGTTGLNLLQNGEWAAVNVPTSADFANPSVGACVAGQPYADSPDVTLAVHAVWIDSMDGLWIGTSFGAARLVVDSVNPTGCWTLFPTFTPEGAPSRVQSLAGDGEGSIWAVTDGGGALLFEDFGDVTLAFGRNVPGNLSTNFVRDVAIDQDGSVWFATPVGVFQYLDRTWYLETSHAESVGLTIGEPDLHDIRDMHVDSQGLIWIATGAGVRVKEASTEERTRYSTDNSNLPGNNIYALVEDRDGGIWAGTDGSGAARFSNERWSPIEPAKLPSPNITALAADEDGTVWLGTDKGLAVYSLDSESFTTLDEFDAETVKSLQFDSANRLWVASVRQSSEGVVDSTIWRLTAQGTAFDIQKEPLLSIFQGDALPYEFELSLAADYRFPGGMWLAIDQIGLYYWDGSQWHNGDPDGHLPTDFLWTLYTSPSSNDLWVGNEGGVSRFDGRTWGTLKDADGLASSAIWAIDGSAEEGFWFGGRSGLSYYRPDNTPPWVRIDGFSGAIGEVDSDGFLSVGAGEALNLTAMAGDLQTPQDKLKFFYRRVPLLDSGEADLTDVEWVEIEGVLPLLTDTLGKSRIELQARDLAFNYSAVMAIPLAVIPTNVIDLGAIGLGKVARNTFFALIAISIVVILGFGYVSLEIISNRRRTIEAMVRSYNPYVSGEPVRRDDMFFGRHTLLQRIINTLHNNSIMLHGERRIGKTTMLYQIAGRLEDVDDPDYWFVPIYVDLEGTRQELFFHFLLEEILHQIQVQHRRWHSADEPQNMEELSHDLIDLDPSLATLSFHEVPEEAYNDRAFNRDLRKVVRYLTAYGEEHHPEKKLRLILMLDEMDVMSSYDHLVQQQLRRIFMRDFASTIGAVVAGIQISQDWDRIESPWYNMFNEIEVEPFTNDQGVELLVEPVKNYYTYDNEAVDFIIEHSEGRPFRIQQYGLEVVTSMLNAGRRRITVEDVLVAHQNIQNSYTSTHSEDGLLPLANQPLAGESSISGGRRPTLVNA